MGICVFACIKKKQWEKEKRMRGREEDRGRDEVPDIIWFLGGGTNRSNC